jgi:HAD superfamily hydrolase (TIGR01509 family)
VAAVTHRPDYDEQPVPAFLFDLDGTLIDSVYQNVIAWRNALAKLSIDLSVWRIHRRIGMSGGLFVAALLLAELTANRVPWAIATSSREAVARRALPMLGLSDDAPMVTRNMVRHAKPDPDLFLAAAALLGIDARNAMVVGDSSPAS